MNKNCLWLFLMCYGCNLQGFNIASIQKYAESGAVKVEGMQTTLTQYGELAESLLSQIETQLCGNVSYDAYINPQSGGLTFNSDGSYANCNSGYMGSYNTVNAAVYNWMNVIDSASIESGSDICSTSYLPANAGIANDIQSIIDGLNSVIAVIGAQGDTGTDTLVGIDYNIQEVQDNLIANTNVDNILTAFKAMDTASQDPAIAAFTNSTSTSAGTGCYDNAIATCKANPQYATNQTVCLASNYKNYNSLAGNAIDGYCATGTNPCEHIAPVPWCSCSVLTNFLIAMQTLLASREAFYDAIMTFQPYTYISVVNTALDKGLFTLSCPNIFEQLPSICTAAQDVYGPISYPSSQCTYGYMTANSVIGGVDCSLPANIGSDACLSVENGYIEYIQTQLSGVQTQIDNFNKQYFNTIQQRFKAVVLQLKTLSTDISSVSTKLTSLGTVCKEDIRDALERYNKISGILKVFYSVAITTFIMVATGGLAVPFLPLVVGALTSVPVINNNTIGLLSKLITNEIVPKPVTPIT